MASILKVNTIQDTDGNNIINENSNVITIGASGDTITVPAGATVSGFTSAGIDDNATSTAITIDSSENVGIGVIPEAWNSNNTALQIGNAGALFASTNDSFVGLTANAYFDSINSRYEYINTDYATIYQQIDGTHIWSTAASGSADNAITFSETMRIDSSGNVGIGTSSPSRPLDVVTSNNLPIRTESSAAQNYLQQTNSTGTTYIVSTGDNFFIGTGSSGTERMRITSAGLVGIGTSSPNTKLEISASTPDIQLTDSDGTNQFATIKQDGSNLKILSRNNTVSGGIVLKRNIGGTETDAFQIQSNGDISFYDSGGSNQNLFWDASTSRLGIGTTSPDTRLHIEFGNASATGNTYSTAILESNNPFNVLQFLSPNTASQQLRFGDPQDNGAGYIQFNHSDNSMSFGSPSEHMRITSAGNVGIGTSSPIAKLHVDTSNSGVTPNTYADDLFIESSGNTGLTIGSGTSSYSSIYFANSTDNDKARIEVVHSDNSMRFTNNASERMRIDSSGKVLVNTTSNGTESNLNVGGQFGLSSGRGFVFEKQEGANGSYNSVTLQFTTGANGRTCFIETMVGSSGYYLYHVSHRYRGDTPNVLVNQGNGPTISWSVSNSGSNTGSVYTYVVNFPSSTSHPYAKFKVSLGGYITTPITSTSISFA